MDSLQFPSDHLDNSTVKTHVDDLLAGDTTIGQSRGASGIIQIWRTIKGQRCDQFNVSSFYRRYLELLLFRSYSLAIVLKHWDNLKATNTQTMTTKAWITLAQHLTYFKQVLLMLHCEALKGDVDKAWRCSSLDCFLVVELVVKRHEPIYLYAYRASRQDGDPNINTCPLDSDKLDLGAYTKALGILSGETRNFRIEQQSRTLQTARGLVKPLLAYYDNSNRVLIADPYICLWANHGLSIGNPFGGDVTDTETSSDEDGDEDGDEDEEAAMQVD